MKEYNDDLSPEEAEINRILVDASEKIKDIDNRLNNLPPISGPSLTPGREYFTQMTEEKREHMKKGLEYTKDLIKAETKDKAVKQLENSPLAVQLRAYDTIDQWAEPKGDKGKNIEERTAREKDLSYSQDTSMRILSDEKNRTGKHLNMDEKGVSVETKNTEKVKPLSMSMRFQATLHYNDVPNTYEEPNRIPDLDKNK